MVGGRTDDRIVFSIRYQWEGMDNDFVDIPEILNKSIPLSIWFLYWQDRNVTRVSAGYEKAFEHKALSYRFEAFRCSSFWLWGSLANSLVEPV